MKTLLVRPFGLPESARSPRGFALVVSVMLLVLISLLAVAMTGLASIELRRSGSADHLTTARDNARLALMQALDRLQKTAGPDQRITASAELLAKDETEANTFANPHWTGVWRSTHTDGTSFFERNDTSGGLSDRRFIARNAVEPQFLGWMVSGGEDLNKDAAKSALTDEAIDLGQDEQGRKVMAPSVAMKDASNQPSGHYAWWAGDLGVRANVATRDAWEAQAQSEPQKWWRVMASQKAETEQMNGGVKLADEDVARLASGQTTALTAAGKQWAENQVFNVTVDSQGVLADAANGGLKRDLTAFLSDGDGQIAAKGALAGLKDADPIVMDNAKDKRTGPFRHAAASPTFGLLRDWAKINAPLSGKNVAAKLPEHHTGAPGANLYELANAQPVKLASNKQPGLQPILVEATLYTTYGGYPMPGNKWQIRQNLYPRVVLWNPYNVELDFEQAMVYIQGNGHQDMGTDVGSLRMFEGGRDATNWFGDPFIGTYYFAIPKTRFAPGDCLVFSPPGNIAYQGWTIYNPTTNFNLLANMLSCEVTPDVSRNYWVAPIFTPLEGWGAKPSKYYYAAQPTLDANTVQAQDTRAILKSAAGVSRVGSYADLDSLPQISVLSGSLQYGAGKEPKLVWSTQNDMPWETFSSIGGVPTIVPNVRTREAIRMRWFNEHTSNINNAGSTMRSTPHFEEAMLANWNPRASFVIRSPWENIAGQGAPWFWGAYTRDLFDGAVSWNEQMPMFSGGRARGNPFGPPQEGADRYVLFDVPRDQTGVLSLAQYQHVKLSEFVWHPSYAVGNSIVDPRLGTAGSRSKFTGIARTAALSGDSASASLGGFGDRQVGSPTNSQRNDTGRTWGEIARLMIGNTPLADNVVYDLSFEANKALWDGFFLSTGDERQKAAFAKDPARDPLPNGRMRLVADGDADSLDDDLVDFHKAASRLMVDGAFNVNSTRKEAWKALLASTRNAGYKGSRSNIPFPRVLNAPGRAWKTGDPTDFDNIWDCYRELTPAEVDRLAEEIVAEVRLRGPFLSLADFVNRRLKEDETGLMGPLDAAIRRAGLNATLTNAYKLNNANALPSPRYTDINITDGTKLEQAHKPDSKAWGSPAWLNQADVLQVIGPALSARSDTFVIRAYGDSVVNGKLMARAWCEAVVQRLPDPVDPDDSGINPADLGTDKDLGRRFTIRSFRWLAQEEVDEQQT